MSRPTRLRVAAAVVLAVLAGLAALNAFSPLPEHLLDRPASTLVLDREGRPLHFLLAPDQRWRLPVELDEISPQMVQTLLNSEDRFFYNHPGVNPLAVVRAGWHNLRAGRVVSGASTLTMQIARMMEKRRRTLRSKIWESFRALQLEWRYSKDELLALYLNKAPFGGNIEGVEAAARLYFGKPAARLSWSEAALLAALPRSPVAYDPTRDAAAARRVRDRILRRLSQHGVLPAYELEDALRQPVPERRRALLRRAPHFSLLAARRYPSGGRVTTSLDAASQSIVEGRIRAAVEGLRKEGIDNASVVVLENSGRGIRALAGSAGFDEVAFDGQVNGALARRSPGSTLKPFLFAAAFDQGLISPDSFLLDVPTDFGGYDPENFDRRYRGRVTARQALIRSLNVPAVRLLSRLGAAPFLQLLRRGGLQSLDEAASHYGLLLILGGGEVTLLELTNLYATLAAGGNYLEPSLTGRGPTAPLRLFSEESAGAVGAILQQLQRPDRPRGVSLSRDAPAVAWKTGTSFGHRDAWAIGYGRNLTIGVWVGNFSGRPREGLSGATHAAPLLFELFGALEQPGSRLPPPQKQLAKRRVCALSHQLPGRFCGATTEIAVLAGRTRQTECRIHRRILVDADTGQRLLGPCGLERKRRAFRIHTFWPPELVAWHASRGETSFGAPPISADCRAAAADGAVRILSPGVDAHYVRRRHLPGRLQQLPLQAAVAAADTTLFWFQDGQLVGSAPARLPLYVDLEPGPHRIVVSDGAGNTASLRYTVSGVEE